MLALVSAAHVDPAPAKSEPQLPIFEVHEVERADRPSYEIAILAPTRWPDRSVRTGLLRKAAQVAAGRGARCFAIERAQLNRNVSYVPLRSGHMTISTSGSAAEWRRYWRLYQHVLDKPGVHFGLGSAPPIGSKVVEGRMIIRLCGPGVETSGDLFEVDQILSRIRTSAPAGSR
ncbi:hypothetical protein [Sphingomonas koreensis]|uniref:Uncharacterized protein n=1 Tax=Sphingomonas sanxanigenens DSM 19645 = NX02 TaxID=1123269 RepID=A0A0F7JSP9_9SPHN|nr:hypothetical protein [Sphingomonas koreensis]AKH18692.1 hypothetical protein NX02_p0255 [Sphingomonas sanxanigenens DSM 19645 = NX02]RSU87990.1 hypothetical protein CA256_22015 [Sphingomonas koreensis]